MNLISNDKDGGIHETKIAQYIVAPLKITELRLQSTCAENFVPFSRLAQAVLKANGLSQKLIGKGKLGFPLWPQNPVG